MLFVDRVYARTTQRNLSSSCYFISKRDFLLVDSKVLFSIKIPGNGEVGWNNVEESILYHKN